MERVSKVRNRVTQVFLSPLSRVGVTVNFLVIQTLKHFLMFTSFRFFFFFASFNQLKLVYPLNRYYLMMQQECSMTKNLNLETILVGNGEGKGITALNLTVGLGSIDGMN